MGIAPIAFSGLSQYSTDFKTILDRTVRIASFPLTALQNENADLLARKTQLGSLRSAVDGLAGSFQALAETSGNRALAASSSNASVVSVTAAGPTEAASYTINSVTSLARAASERTLAGYGNAEPVSASGTVRLQVGSQTYDLTLTPATNNLAGLRDAINSRNAGVTATLLTTGAPEQPNYLVLTARNPGATTLALREDPDGVNTNLLTAANQGSDAVFQLNGIEVRKQTNTVNGLVGGLTFTLLGETAAPVTISLGTSRSSLRNALAAFADSYNTAREAVDAQVGANAGLLSGDLLVREVQSSLRAVASYAGTGPIRSLTQLGITFGSDGRARFDAAVFNALPDAALNDVFDFLGSPDAGFGRLVRRFTQLSNPDTGLFRLQVNAYDQTDKRLQEQIGVLTERVRTLQNEVNARLQAYDAVLARLESQQRLVGASIESLRLALFGKKDA
jgi:flagellar hook-associated protein 2